MNIKENLKSKDEFNTAGEYMEYLTETRAALLAKRLMHPSKNLQVAIDEISERISAEMTENREERAKNFAHDYKEFAESH